MADEDAEDLLLVEQLDGHLATTGPFPWAVLVSVYQLDTALAEYYDGHVLCLPVVNGDTVSYVASGPANLPYYIVFRRVWRWPLDEA